MLCYRQLLGRGIYLFFLGGGGNEKRDKYEKSSTNLNGARGKFFNNVKEGVHFTLHNATLGRNIHHTPVAGLNIHR